MTDGRVRHNGWLIPAAALVLTAAGVLGPPAAAGEKEPAAKPAVLFAFTRERLHVEYAAQRFYEQGLEIDQCRMGELQEHLDSGRYNVVVVGTTPAEQLPVLDEFLAAGGGVFMFYPGNPHAHGEAWTASLEWLREKGAASRYDVLTQTEKEKLYIGALRMRYSWTDRVAGDFADGVEGLLLYTLGKNPIGQQPLMSYDFGEAWSPTVRAGDGVVSTPVESTRPIHQPWIPATTREGEAVTVAGVRQVGEGRLGVMGLPLQWTVAAPRNCPAAEEMLFGTVAQKRSDWLRYLVNAYRWLAEPSLAKGYGGAETPYRLMVWNEKKVSPPDFVEWSETLAADPEVQSVGLLGARTELSGGQGSVRTWVAEAKKAGLDFIAFLEPLRELTRPEWQRLTEACAELSDESFVALPGLLIEDAQGNHIFSFAGTVDYPDETYLTGDRRLATVGQKRIAAYFEYHHEQLGQRAATGFWRHDENYIHYVDYKMYNGFAVKSFVDGEPVDDAEEEYAYLNGVGCLPGGFALEIMTRPELVAERAAQGWKTVVDLPLSELSEKLRARILTFSGNGGVYITSGPTVDIWKHHTAGTWNRGQWWRPDVWQYRDQIKVTSPVGLKTVVLRDGDQRVLRRWALEGEKEFYYEFVNQKAQQRGLYVVAEDMEGGRAITTAFFPRNLLMEQFYCSDRCNFLGNARAVDPETQQWNWLQTGMTGHSGITPNKGTFRIYAKLDPTTTLTKHAATLPIDGRPMGEPGARVQFYDNFPGRVSNLYSWPQVYLIGPDIAIGQTDLKLQYWPGEEGATETPLGYTYEGKQLAFGGAWSSWHKLEPIEAFRGTYRAHAANRRGRGFRLGWAAMEIVYRRATPVGEKKALHVANAGGKGNTWRLYRGGEEVDLESAAGGEGPLDRGTFAVHTGEGGATMIVGLGEGLEYSSHRTTLRLRYPLDKETLAPGDAIRFRIGYLGNGSGTRLPEMVQAARDLGIATPGRTAYQPEVSRGEELDRYFLWQLRAADGAVNATAPRASIDGYVTARVEGFNDNWPVYLLDRNRAWPNYRKLPLRDGVAYAQIDFNERDVDLFIGHPLRAQEEALLLHAVYLTKGQWRVEAHNPTEAPLETTVRSDPDWPLFSFEKRVSLKPGTSQSWLLPVEADRRGAIENLYRFTW
jgi:hypothetical protein